MLFPVNFETSVIELVLKAAGSCRSSAYRLNCRISDPSKLGVTMLSGEPFRESKGSRVWNMLLRNVVASDAKSKDGLRIKS